MVAFKTSIIKTDKVNKRLDIVFAALVPSIKYHYPVSRYSVAKVNRVRPHWPPAHRHRACVPALSTAHHRACDLMTPVLCDLIVASGKKINVSSNR